MTDRTGHVAALDGLRAVAVLSVVIHHAWGAALPGGWVGVDVFFVLSGYLITSLLVAEHARTGRISVGRFYLRRALRLLPALALTLPMGVALAAIARPDLAVATVHEAIAAAAYLANWWMAFVGDPQTGLLSHTWSLSVEEQFYVVWPLVLCGLLPLGGRRLSLWATVGAIALVLLQRHMITGVETNFRTDTRADSLLVGCAIAQLAAGRDFDRVPRRTVRLYAVAGTVVLLLTAAVVGNAAALPAEGLTIVACAAGAIVVAIAVRPLELPSRLLAWRPLAALGRRSYGVYLFHYPLVAGVIVPRLGPGPIAAAAAIAGSTLVACASYRYLEAPFLRLRTRGAPASPSPPILVPAARPAGGHATEIT
jgi:peptidoglycan/LPS O-acetylase OafA/YrhL